MEDMLKQILAELQEMRHGDSAMKSDIGAMRSDISAIKSDIAKLNHAIVPKVNAIYEGIGGIQEKFIRLDKLETKVDGHGDRIYALEQERKA